MTERTISTPVEESTVRDLSLGDIVYVDGVLITARDEAHIRALEYLEEGKELPVNFKEAVLFHCGPIMRRKKEKGETEAQEEGEEETEPGKGGKGATGTNGKLEGETEAQEEGGEGKGEEEEVGVVEEEWQLIAAGPTTSSRMNNLEPGFIEKFAIRAIIGKGGMSEPTLKAMERCGCVYLAMTGGAAVLAARGVEKVMEVHWLDLGMPEALWVMSARKFGPLIVAMDTKGNSMYDELAEDIERNYANILKKWD